MSGMNFNDYDFIIVGLPGYTIEKNYKILTTFEKKLFFELVL
jgi:hypothetical protein